MDSGILSFEKPILLRLHFSSLIATKQYKIAPIAYEKRINDKLY